MKNLKDHLEKDGFFMMINEYFIVCRKNICKQVTNASHQQVINFIGIYVYDRLTEIFKTIPAINTNPDYLTSIDNGTFNYKTHLKRRHAFLKFVLPLLKDKRDEAIKNAEKLRLLYNGEVPYHDCNPCTLVHLLVKDILLSTTES